MSQNLLRRAGPYAAYGALLVVLILVLLRSQGLLGRREHPTQAVPTAGVALARFGAVRTVAVQREVAPVLQFHPGQVAAIDPARIAARVMAVVREVTVRDGDTVAEGALLVQLDDTDAVARRAQAHAGVEAATARLTAAALACVRAERLSEQGNLSAQVLEGARADRDAASARVAEAGESLAEAEAAVSWHRITAPFGGRILARAVERGDLAQPGRVLVSLYRADHLRVVAALPERYAADVEAGGPLTVECAGLAPLTLAATRVSPAADAATGTVMVELDLPADVALGSTLRPGLLVRVGLAVGERARLVVPAAAIERIGQVERAWLAREGHALSIHVRTVPARAGFVEVLAGLAEGDEVLVP